MCDTTHVGECGKRVGCVFCFVFVPLCVWRGGEGGEALLSKLLYLSDMVGRGGKKSSIITSNPSHKLSGDFQPNSV